MKTAKTEKRRRFAAIDALIIILLMLCVAGIAVRTVTGSVGLFSGSGSGSYRAQNISSTPKTKDAFAVVLVPTALAAFAVAAATRRKNGRKKK